MKKPSSGRQRSIYRQSILRKKRLKWEIKEAKKRKFYARKRLANASFEKPRYPTSVQEDGAIQVRMPVNFDLLNNMEETLLFFEEVHYHAKRRRTIRFDLSQVTTLSPESLLYLLSLFDLFQKLYGGISVSGNRPLDKGCDELLMQSGFFKFIKTQGQLPASTSGSILSMESGTVVDPIVASKIVAFAKKHLKNESFGTRSSSFEVIVEAMDNTRTHAYIGNRRPIKPNWWVIAIYNDSRKVINFVFLDNGIGIPLSLRRNVGEKLRQLTGKIDAMLIDSALRGDDERTRTKLPQRGKGLPYIYELSSTSQIYNLKVLSNRGFVDCANNKKHEITQKFYGTLLSWEFSS